MKYSFAFNRLLALTYEVELLTSVQYKRVSIFLGRLLVAGKSKKMGHAHPLSWAEEYAKFDRDVVLALVAKLQDREWEMISRHMRELAAKSSGSDEWKRMRQGWVTDLDTIRAFG